MVNETDTDYINIMMSDTEMIKLRKQIMKDRNISELEASNVINNTMKMFEKKVQSITTVTLKAIIALSDHQIEKDSIGVSVGSSLILSTVMNIEADTEEKNKILNEVINRLKEVFKKENGK